MNKKTYGQIIQEQRAKNLTLDDDVIEYRKQMEPAVIAEMNRQIALFKDTPTYANKDFYQTVHFRVEKVGQQPGTVVITRLSCPGIFYQTAVFKYRHTTGEKEFLWSLPGQLTYWYIWKNKEKFLEDPETKQIAQFVCLAETGELLKWIKKENGNKEDAVIRINKPEEACQIN